MARRKLQEGDTVVLSQKGLKRKNWLPKQFVSANIQMYRNVQKEPNRRYVVYWVGTESNSQYPERTIAILTSPYGGGALSGMSVWRSDIKLAKEQITQYRCHTSQS